MPQKSIQVFFIDEAIANAKSTNLPEKDPKGISAPKSNTKDGVRTQLHLSLLSGEYISCENYIDKLKALRDATPTDVNAFIDKVIKFATHIRNTLESKTEQTQAFYFVDEISKVFEIKEIDGIQTKIKQKDKAEITLLEANLLLCELDFSLECSEKYLRTVLRIYHAFSESKEQNKSHKIPNNFTSVLKEKCEILLYKVMKRLEIDRVSDEMITGSEGAELYIEDLRNDSLFFKKFFDQTSEVYGGKATAEEFSSDDSISLGKEILTTFEIHRISKKAYKSKSLKGRETISALHKKIVSHPRNRILIDQFNQYSNRNLKVLLFKNELKILKHEIEDFIKIEDSYKNIETLRNFLIQTNKIYENSKKYLNENSGKIFINDYYHHYLYTDICCSIIEFCYLNSYKEKGFYAIAESILNNLESEKILKTINDCLSWVRATNYLPVYATFEECKTEEVEILSKCRLFLDSSYVLPVNYARQKERYETLKQKVFYLELLSKRFQTINEELGNFTRLIDDKLINENTRLTNTYNTKLIEFDGKIRDASISGIQTLGIFASIISLVLGFFNILPKIDNIWIVVFFMIGFSGCLIFFVHALARTIDYTNLEKSKLIKNYYLYTLIVLGLFLILFSNCEKFKEITYSSPYNKKDTVIVVKETVFKDSVFFYPKDSFKK